MSTQSTGIYASQPVIQSSGYSVVIPRIINNITKIALPAMAFFAMANVPSVAGGPLSYSACVLGCSTFAPPAMPACFNLCLGFLFLPTTP